jgi:O-antigen/teichoic acid export membrane protein
MNNKKTEQKEINQELITVTKGAGFSFFGQIFGKGSKFIITFLLTHILNINQFGLYSLGETIVNILSGASHLGLNRGVLKNIAAHKKDKAKIKGALISSIIISLLMGTIIGFLTFLFSEKISLLFKDPELNSALKLFSFSIPLLTLLSVIANSTLGFKTTKYLVLGNTIFKNLANLCFIVLFYFLSYKVIGMIWAFILSILVSTTITLYYLKKLYSKIPPFQKIKAKFKNKVLISNSFPLLLEGLFISLIGWMDILMVGYFFSSSEVGIYKIAITISTLIIVFRQTFSSIFQPIVSEYFFGNKMISLEKIFKVTSKWVLYFSIPIFLIITLCPKELLMIFGGEFSQGLLPLLILSTGKFITIFFFGASTLLAMTTYQKLNAVITGFGVFLNFCLNIFFLDVLHMGIEGAAIATAITLISINIGRFYQVKKTFRIHFFSIKTFTGIIGFIIAFFSTLIVKYYFFNNLHYLLNILLSFVLATLIFGAFILLTGVEKEDKFILNKIKNKIS